MIGVSLHDGKTLNVTFRSINTRTDIFHPKKFLAEKRKPAISTKQPSLRTSSQEQPQALQDQHQALA